MVATDEGQAGEPAALLRGWVTVRPARSVRALLPGRQRLYAVLEDGALSFAPSPSAEATLCAPLPALSVRVKRSHLTLRTAGLALRIAPEAAGLLPAWGAALSATVQRDFSAAYTLHEVLGTGSFAAVHRATHVASGAAVAVKRIATGARRAQSAAQVAMELRVMTAVRHPGLMAARAVFRDRAAVHIVMDLMPGGSLKEVVCAAAARGAPEAHAAGAALQVLRALAHLHARGVAHRDVKLENVLCARAGLPAEGLRLGDFGFAVDEARTPPARRSAPVGTPVYVAPESARGEPHGAPVDVFAVGVMAYRMLAAAYPYEGKDDRATMRRAAAGGPVSFSARAFADVSAAGIRFLRATLQPDPRKRLSADGALLHPWLALARAEEAAMQDAGEAGAGPPRERGPREVARGRWRVAVCAVTFVGRLQSPVERERAGSPVALALRRLSLEGPVAALSDVSRRTSARIGATFRKRMHGKEGRLGGSPGAVARFQMPAVSAEGRGGEDGDGGLQSPNRM